MGFARPMPDSILYNLAESFEFHDEGRTAIFKIRKGIKWSDGVPFTVDDILFWYYDMTFDDNARPHNQPVPPSVWVVDGKPIDLKKIDDHTLEVSSSKPLGRVLHALCLDVIAQPKHHLSHLHPRYNPEATYEEFREQATNAMVIMKPGMPRLSALGPRRMDSRSAHRLCAQPLLLENRHSRQSTALCGPHRIYRHSRPSGDPAQNCQRRTRPVWPLLSHQHVSHATHRRKKGQIQIADQPDQTAARHTTSTGDTPKPALREAFRNRDVRIALSLCDQPRRNQPDRLSRSPRSRGLLLRAL